MGKQWIPWINECFLTHGFSVSGVFFPFSWLPAQFWVYPMGGEAAEQPQPHVSPVSRAPCCYLGYISHSFLMALLTGRVTKGHPLSLPCLEVVGGGGEGG